VFVLCMVLSYRCWELGVLGSSVRARDAGPENRIIMMRLHTALHGVKVVSKKSVGGKVLAPPPPVPVQKDTFSNVRRKPS
jgi:hypothetical protein